MTRPRVMWARSMVDETLVGQRRGRLRLVVLLAVLRLTTKPRVRSSLRTAEAFVSSMTGAAVRGCLAPDGPSRRPHARLPDGGGTAGNLPTDAHLAALSVEYGAAICSYDADFSRFPGVKLTSRQGPVRPPSTGILLAGQVRHAAQRVADLPGTGSGGPTAGGRRSRCRVPGDLGGCSSFCEAHLNSCSSLSVAGSS